MIFVLVSLVALVLVPVAVDWLHRGLRRQIEEVIDPARDRVDDLELAFAREAATVRTYVVAPSRATAALYWRIRREEADILDALTVLTRPLDARVTASLDSLEAIVATWHREQEALLAGRLPPSEYTRLTTLAEPRYEEIIRATDAVDAELDRIQTALLRRIAATERLGLIFTVGLVVLAFISALAVLRIDRQQRRLAARLERRAREERALREAAAAVSGAPTIDEALRRITESSVTATGADGAFLERVDPERGGLEVVWGAGSPVLERGEFMDFQGSMAEHVLSRKRPELVERIPPQGVPFPPALVRKCADCSAIVVPLEAGGEEYGALFLLRVPEHGTFGDADVERARTYGNLASLVFRNIHLLDESERGRRELEQVMESRARLVRGFSHDVKNPIGAAAGYAELLEEEVLGELTSRQHESVQRIRRSLDAALGLIDDLTELARAEAGQLEIVRRPTDVRRIVAETVEEYRAGAETGGLTLSLDLPERLPLVATDASRLRQILGNLVSNAVKYTPADGRITVRVRECTAPAARRRAGGEPARPEPTRLEPTRLEPTRPEPTRPEPPRPQPPRPEPPRPQPVRLEPPRPQPPRPEPARAGVGGGPAISGWICVDVSDTGPGIPAEQWDAIFEEFTRLGPGAKRGAGLGLAISRRIARLLGGDVTVQSEVGRGSTFTITLPIAAAGEAAQPRPAA